jgi:hypothetical protein
MSKFLFEMVSNIQKISENSKNLHTKKFNLLKDNMVNESGDLEMMKF